MITMRWPARSKGPEFNFRAQKEATIAKFRHSHQRNTIRNEENNADTSSEEHYSTNSRGRVLLFIEGSEHSVSGSSTKKTGSLIDLFFVAAKENHISVLVGAGGEQHTHTTRQKNLPK